MYNPVRRSKKIGLTQGGRVKDGKPMEKWSRVFSQSTWEKLSQQGPIRRIIRENPSRDYFHPVTGTDVKDVLRRLPKNLTAAIKAVVLRRLPDFDERVGIEARLEHQCVILNSFPRDGLMRLSHKPSASVIRHYEPWSSSEWREIGGEWTLSWDSQELKQYYLYHLLLHEIGHLWQPAGLSRNKREDFAENFALEWAAKLGELR